MTDKDLAERVWLTTAQAAEYVERHPNYILAAASSGDLQSTQAGRGRGRRYRREWLDQWMSAPQRRRTRRDRDRAAS